MNAPDTLRCENPDHCVGGSVNVAAPYNNRDEGVYRDCDTCGGRHEVWFSNARDGRFSVRCVVWSPEDPA